MNIKINTNDTYVVFDTCVGKTIKSIVLGGHETANRTIVIVEFTDGTRFEVETTVEGSTDLDAFYITDEEIDFGRWVNPEFKYPIMADDFPVVKAIPDDSKGPTLEEFLKSLGVTRHEKD